MNTINRMIVCLLVCGVGANTVGCTSLKTMHPVTDPATPTFGSVKAGDTVIVEMRDGRRARFVVEQVDGDAIVSKDGVRYGRSEISRLQRQSFSGWKTALLVVGLSGAVIVVLAAIAVSQLSDNLY